jgi:hypothetical protein
VVAATAIFDRIARRALGAAARFGSVCFAACMVVPVVIGQLTFLLGLALGLAALLAMLDGRRRLLVALGVSCALASFVAALFLAIAAGACWLTWGPGRRLGPALLAASSTLPIVVVGLAYHQAGVFPFPATTLAAVLAVCAGAALALPEEHRTLRLGVALYAATSIALFVLHTPVGANMARLATTVAAPVIVCLGRRRLVVLALVGFIFAWQIGPAIGAIDIVDRDPSTQPSFYAPLVAEIAHLDPRPTRLEIPLTHEHWEAAWVAPKIALARGWERQLDVADNHLFYSTGALTRDSFGAWLRANGVEWVALPRAPLDYSAVREAALLRHGAPYLRPVWHQRDWQLWRVVGSPGLVSGPAELTDLDAGGFTLDVRAPGTSVVRIHSTPTWSIVDRDGNGCLTSTAHAWTVVHAERRGPIRVEAGMLPSNASSC